MNHKKRRVPAVLNIIGSWAYIACLLQWLWMIMLLLPSIVESPVFRFFSPQTTPVAPLVPAESVPTPGGDIPIVVTLLALLVGVVVIVVSGYVMFVKLPRSVAKVGEAITHTPATVISPIIIHHVQLPAKQRRSIPLAIIILMKLFLVFTPLCLLLLTRNLSLAMSFELIMLIGIVLFAWSFLLFAVQFCLSQLLRIDYKTIR